MLVGLVFAVLATCQAIETLSPLRFSEDGLPFVWSETSWLTAMLHFLMCVVAGLILPVWFDAIPQGIAVAAVACMVVAICIQTHIGSCLLWLLAYGFIAVRTSRAALRMP